MCLTDKTVHHKCDDHADHTRYRNVEFQTESQNNKSEIQFHRTAKSEILSVIQKGTVKISPDKSADHKADQDKDDQNPIHSFQGVSSSFFCVLFCSG